MKKMFFLNIVLLILHSISQAQWMNISPVVALLPPPQQIYEMKVSDRYLYACCGDEGFYIFDIIDPTNPLIISTLFDNGFTICGFLSLYGDNIIIINGGDHHNIETIDVSDPENPIAIGHLYNADFRLRAQVISGRYMYIPDYRFGIRIFDISDPINIVQINAIETVGRARDLKIQGDYLYLSANDVGMLIYALNDSVNLIERGTWLARAQPHDPDRGIFYLAVDGNYAYTHSDGLNVIDITNPDNPVTVSYFEEIRPSFGIYKIGPYLYCFGGLDGQFQLVCVNDPENPIITGYQRDYPYTALVPNQSGELLFADKVRQGLSVMDCSPALSLPERVPLHNRRFELVSSYARPDSLDAEFIFGGVDSLRIVYQNDGAVYIPDLVNTIEEFDPTQGYLLFCDEDSEIQFMGECMTAETVYHLPEDNWCWLGYPFYYSVPIEDAFSGEFADEVAIVMNDDGEFWIPYGINTIGDMRPGDGYYVFSYTEMDFEYHDWRDDGLMNADGDCNHRTRQDRFLQGDVFTLKNNRTRAETKFDQFSLGTSQSILPNHEEAWKRENGNLHSPKGAQEQEKLQSATSNPQSSIQKTGIPYIVLVALSEELTTKGASVIELYDGDVLVGKAEIQEYGENHNVTPVVAWKGSPERNLSGFNTGHPITVRVLSNDGSKLAETAFETCRYGEGPYAEVEVSLNSNPLPLEFKVGSTFPNPFNSTVTISFSVPATGEVNFVLFNLLGQEVFEEKLHFEAGYHQLAVNTELSQHAFVSSVYFLQVQYHQQVFIKKIVLVK